MRGDELVDSLWRGIERAIADGCTRLVIWGVDVTGVALLSRFCKCGLMSSVHALVDSRSALHGRRIFGVEVQAPEALIDSDFDALVVTSDRCKEHVLEQFAELSTRIPRTIFSGDANYDFADPVFFRILASCPVPSKAGGYPQMLVHLYQALRHIAARGLSGHVAEFGVYQGGTTVFMAKVLQHFGHTARVYGFDTFEGFPHKSHVLDTYHDPKCEFHDYETVRRYCQPYNIELIQGDIRKTCLCLRDVPLALTFCDTDSYTATKKALELCYEQTVVGGFFAFDHYYSPHWGQTIGERIAVRQVFKDKMVFNLHGTGIFVKM